MKLSFSTSLILFFLSFQFKFAIITSKIKFIGDDPDCLMNINELKGSSTNMKPWLGLEHVNKAPKRSRFNYLEKAIKIYN